jgi:hypothetical protein
MLAETFDNMKGLKMNIKGLYENALDALQHAEHEVAKIAVRQHAIMLEEWEHTSPNTKPEFDVQLLWHLGNDFPKVLIRLDADCEYAITRHPSPYRGKGRFMFREIIDEDSDGSVYGATIIIDDKMLNGDEEGFRQELRAIIESTRERQ